MSQENIELIQRLYEEFGRTGGVEVWALHPDIEWHTAADLPDSAVHRGRDGVSALIDEWVASFEDLYSEVLEVIDRGEHVVVSLVLRGRISGGGEEVALPETHVWKLRDGQVVEVREYRTLDEGLEAVDNS
jgi:ketosteroid isomerase-like protein